LEREIVKARMQRKDFSDLQAQKDAANAEMDRLIDLEPEPARIDYEDTGLTFREWWETHDTAARNAFLREQGVKVVISSDPLPEDLLLARPDMIWSVSAIERPGMHAILYMGDLGELLSRASELSITVSVAQNAPLVRVGSLGRTRRSLAAPDRATPTSPPDSR
jgi:hypothetical protein